MHHHHHHHHPDSGKNIRLAFFLNLAFAVVELIGGFFTNSIAILSDALHDFGDSLSLGVTWYLQGLSKKKRDADFTYGYKRFSLLGAVLISAVLIGGSCFVILEGVQRIVAPQPVDTTGMFVLAVAGIAVNGLAVFRLKRGTSFNERAVYLHLMEDVLGWIAVLTGSIVMKFADWPVLDPILSLAISGWVLYNAARNLSGTFRILLQGTPKGMDVDGLKAEISALGPVASLHDFHLWSLDGDSHVLSLHAVVDPEIGRCDPIALKSRIRAICDNFHIHHATIEVEDKKEDCGLMHC